MSLELVLPKLGANAGAGVYRQLLLQVGAIMLSAVAAGVKMFGKNFVCALRLVNSKRIYKKPS